MKKQKEETKKKKQKPKPAYANGNGTFLVEGWGMVHCAECDLPVAFYTPDTDLGDDDNLELYCQKCAIALNQREQ